MLSKTIETYGGPFLDETAVKNPETQQAADQANRCFEDVAQMTRTSLKALVKFQTTATVGPVAVTVLTGTTSQWGSGSGSYPTIQKTATGTYVITYPETYVDALVGTTVTEEETVDFQFANPVLRGPTKGDVQHDITNNVVTIYVFNTSDALSDLGGGKTIEVSLR